MFNYDPCEIYEYNSSIAQRDAIKRPTSQFKGPEETWAKLVT